MHGHAAPTTTVTVTPVYRARSVAAFMSPAHILTSIQWDELNALNQSSWAQSLAPQTDCTGVKFDSIPRDLKRLMGSTH